MTNNQRNKLGPILGFLLFSLLFLGHMNPLMCQAASKGAITSISVGRGSRAVIDLEDNGYSVIFPNLNASAGSSDAIYIGYKTGSGEAIRGLLLSGKSKETLDVDGITYKRASKKNLNVNSSGDGLYLYYTKDAKAGAALLDLRVNRYEPDGDKQKKGYSLTNDGTSPVRKDSGAAANFEQGNSEMYAYLMMVREDIFRPYVTNVHIACEKSKRSTINKLASLGCDYYVDYEYDTNDSGKIMMIGYQRTADVNEAMTCMMGMDLTDERTLMKDSILWNEVEYEPVDPDCWETYGMCLYATKDIRAGNPVYEIFPSKVDGMQMDYQEWVENNYAGSVVGVSSGYLIQDSDYQDALETDLELHTISMFINEGGEKQRGDWVFLREKAAVANSPWMASDEEMSMAEEASTEDIIENTEESATESEEASTENLIENTEENNMENMEEVILDELEEDQLDLTTKGEEENNTASILGEGNAWLPLLVTTVIVLAGLLFWKRRRS